jgi:hypothetical protein
MHPTVQLTKTGPGLKRLSAGLKLLSGERVLVGIPSDEDNRAGNLLDQAANLPLTKKSETSKKAMSLAHASAKQTIGNAELMFILTNGSQVRGLPATPIIEPAIKAPDNQRNITGALKAAAQAELAGNHSLAIKMLQRAGLLGSNAAKRWFTDPRNGWPPNKRATILRKLGKLTGKRKRAALVALNAGNYDEIDTRNIDTGELRRAITYVVEDGETNVPAPAEEPAMGNAYDEAGDFE